MGADKTNNIMTLSSGVSQPLLADVQYFELYSSSALNRKLKNIVLPGFYCGFEPVPGTGLSVRITSENSEGKGAASVDVNNVQISVQQIEDVTVSVKAGATNIIVLEANFEHGVKTTQVDSASSVSAARIYVRTDNTIGQNQIELCRVIVPSGATAVTKEMIVLKYRVNRAVGVEFSNEISSTEERKAATPLAVKTLHDLVDTKAPLDSPHLSGTPTSPTPEPGTNNTQIANAAFVYAAINALINGAPGTMDTLKEIAAAINNDPNFSTTINNALALKAPLASPALTGIPTAPTAAQGTNNTQIATTAYVRAAISALIGSSPEALDTLNELAAALGNDPNFATTMTNALAGKQPLDATLTALAGLATGANKLPYFIDKDTVAQTDLTSVGRDILAKTSTLAVIQYLGLRELGTSGEKIPLLSTANTWSARQTFNGGITGALTGNADTATKLKTARTINGVGFDGSKDITLTPENLGLTDIVSQAGNAVQRSGDKMTGELKIGTVNALRIFDEAFGLIFRRSEDFLHFIPTAEGQGENGDIGPLRPFAINLRTGAISVSHGAKIEGGLAIGATDNALGENSIVLGDNDTGFRQDGDGIISFYSNGSRIGHIDGLGLYLYKDIESNGSNFRLKSNYRHHITFANEDGSIRMFLWKDNGGDGVHINNGSDGGGDFIFKRDGGFTLGSGAQVASSGDIYGSVWENNWLSTWLHNHVVRDIRLGSIEHKNVWRDYGFGDASGYVLTAAINSNADDIVDTVARRPIQKLIGGIWYNVGSV
ncbi:TPA: tail fiber protein [Escherichia coli]|nr:tail fiber protein [Escherichia coli]